MLTVVLKEISLWVQFGKTFYSYIKRMMDTLIIFLYKVTSLSII